MTFEWVYDILRLISWATYLMSISAIILYMRKSMVKPTILLLCFLVFGILTELIYELLIQLYIVTNIPVIIYTLIITPIIAGIYYIEIKNSWVRKTLIVLTAVFFSYEIIWFIINYQLIMNDSLYVPLTVAVLVLSLVYFFEQFIRMEIPDLTRHFFFWVNSAFLIYFGTSYLLHLFEEIIRSDEYLFAYTWPIQLIATILLNVLITIGAWRTRRT